MPKITINIVLIVLTALFSISACNEGKTPSPTGKVNKKRVGPADVNPIMQDGLRYEAIHWGKSRGLEQNGGYISAVDIASEKEAWLLKVYDISYDGDKEQDKQDRFITELYLGNHGQYLFIRNEKNELFKIELSSRKVDQIE